MSEVPSFFVQHNLTTQNRQLQKGGISNFSATETVPSAATDKPAGVQLAAAIKLDQIDVAIKGGKVEKDDQEVSEVGCLDYVTM